MLKKKIIASSISNLTDARYFAAWGVDYLGFNTDMLMDNKKSQQDIKEIIEWVEGPKFLAETSLTELSDEFFEMFFDLGFDAISIGKFATLNSFPPGVEIFKTMSINAEKPQESYDNIIYTANYLSEVHNNKEKVNEVSSYCNVYLDVQFSLENLMDIEFAGYLVRGEAEEKVGLKTFDELDSFFEYLEA
jgi:phosphoribosylanthranilate isomerase